MARTGCDNSITNCRKAPNAKVYSSFSIGEMYTPSNQHKRDGSR